MTARPERAARPLDLLLATVTLGAVAVSVLALFAELFWMLELLSHFRLQYLAGQLPLLMLCLFRRRWPLVAVLVPCMAINAAVVSPYWPRETATVTGSTEIALMSVNLYSRNDEHARFVELARREQPDILLLLEYTAAWAAALRAIESDYPYRLVEERADFFGIALFSRVPLLDARLTDLLGVPAIDTRLDLDATGEARFVGVHLRPPMSAQEAQERNAQLDLVGRLVQAEAGPLIIAGDFNMTPYSPALAGWLERTELNDARRGRGFGISWPASLPILGIPIDHVLISEDFLISAHYYGSAFGSDHYPVVTRLSLRGD